MSRRQFTAPTRTDAEPPDDTGCTVLHVDMDAFYASASLISRPDLRGKPVIIGGASGRSVVLSATYEARAFGVTSAMPMARARRLCPQAVIIEPDHRRYAAISDAIMATFARSPTASSRSRSTRPSSTSPGRCAAWAVRPRSGSGCATPSPTSRASPAPSASPPTKFVAKLASNLAKPDGLIVVPRDEVVAFLHQLPVGAIWGVGDRTEEHLHRLGLRTVADLAHTPVETLQRALGDSAGRSLHDLAWGRDPRAVVPERREKSIGADETFAHDIDDPVRIHRELLRLSDRTAARARSAGMTGRTVSIKVRFADFTTITRAKTLRHHTDVSREIFDTARELYDRLGLQRARIRLVGVRLEGLVPTAEAPIQARLDEPEHGWRDADRAVDRASARFGAGSVRPASLMPDRPSGSQRDRRELS